MNPDTLHLMATILYAHRHGNASPSEQNMAKCYEEAKRLAAVIQQAQHREAAQTGATK